MSGGVRLIVGALALLGGAFGSADATAQAAPAASEERSVPGWYSELQRLVEKGQAKEARSLLDSQLANEQRPALVGALHRYRAVTDMMLNDRPAFEADVARAVAVSPDPTSHLPAFVEMGTMFDPDVALSSLKRLAAIDPNQARDLDEMIVGRLLQTFRQGHQDEQYDDLTLTLADISYGGILSRDDIQREAAITLIERRELERALEHARQVSGRAGLIDVLTDRRFERIWAPLEKVVGDRMESIGQGNVAKAEAEFKAAPQDIETRLSLMRAYKDLGMWDRADELGKSVATSKDELAALDERTAWIVDEHADILASAGRMDEADARRAGMVQDWSDERGWLISMAINRIGALANAHRYERAFALLDEQKSQLDRYSSPYAKQLLRALRVWMLVGLGRRAEADNLALEVLAHADEAPTATLGALLLLGRDTDAERLAIAWLGDPDKSTDVISFLRIDDSSSTTDDPMVIELLAKFRARPRVAAAFDSKGRDLPKNLRRTY